MNVRQLINELIDYDPDAEILVASDPEGNGFRRLSDVGLSWIEANGDKHGYVESTIHPSDADEYEESELEVRLILWP